MDLRAEVWPLMAKEIAWGWYHELLHGHPERVLLDAETFTARYAAADWGSREMAALLDEAVPDPVDRIDFAALDRPLDGVRAGSLDALQPLVRAHVAEDLRQHVDPAHTPHLGAFVAMLSVYAQVTPLVTEDALTARSKARDVGWWQGLFNGVASGPPGFRVRQLLALSRAGYVRFLGPGMWTEVDGAERCFRAGGSAVPGASVTATAMIDARLQEPSVARTTDPLLAGLLRRGAVAEEILVRRRRHRAAQHRVDPGAACGRGRARRGGPRAPAAVRDRAAHERPRGRGVHPPRHERAEPALQRRRGAGAAAQPAGGGAGVLGGLSRPCRYRRCCRSLSCGRGSPPAVSRVRGPASVGAGRTCGWRRNALRVRASWWATSAAISSACRSMCSSCSARARCRMTSSSSAPSSRSAIERRTVSRVGAGRAVVTASGRSAVVGSLMAVRSVR